MRKYLIYTLIIFLVGAGISFLYNSRNSSELKQSHKMDAMDGKTASQLEQSYEMEVTSKPAGIDPNQPAIFKYIVKNDKDEVLKNYSVVHEKIMHFIVVRRDLQYFQHLHPTFDKATGEYTIAVTFPADGPYRLFPDFTPAKSEDNPEQLTVTLNTDVNVGDMGKYKAQAVTPDTENAKNVNDYKVSYNLPNELKAEKEFSYNLAVEKNGKPVTDLENYLGALGHGVILSEGDLDFIHTHAGEVGQGDSAKMDHGAMTMEKETTKGPKIDFSTTLPEKGVYKIFTQFQHEGKIITTDHVILAE